MPEQLPDSQSTDLQQAHERLQSALATSAVGVWECDVDPDRDLRESRVRVSDTLLELLGYGPDEQVETIDWFVTRYHPDDTAVMYAAADRLLADGTPYDVDVRIRTKSGAFRWYKSRGGYAQWDESAEVYRVSGTMTDITDRKQNEDALRASEARFRSLMEQSPLAIEILTPDGKIQEVNSAWKRLWGLSEEEAVEAIPKYNMLTDPQLAELGLLPLVKKAFAGVHVVLPPIHYDAARAAQDVGLSFPEASAPWVQSHLYPVRDERGGIDYVVNTYMDITELRRVEQEAQEQREAMARVSRASRMGQLTGSIAHELNQPLTGILSTAQAGEMMIQNERMNRDELAEVMAAIVSDAKRAGEVIRNLRELYKDHSAESLPVDVNKLVEETVQMLQSEFVIRRVQVRKELTPSVHPVSGNRVQLQQVLVNLIMNANEAMRHLEPQLRRLTIASNGGENEIRVWVDDCGRGFDKEQMDQIFEPLATWKPDGTGMGLAISNSILESHHGYMWAENGPESGARVGFALPVLQENPTS